MCAETYLIALSSGECEQSVFEAAHFCDSGLEKYGSGIATVNIVGKGGC
jgi:hypothetical protein